ncbi:hypothetical protein [Streptomyces sp. NPDC002133]|uniref:hypothetical protein n=1 Tax=Streptomyces sp. NPDC002133 TaxID=3154409 RepID=UPI003317BA3D
MSTGPDPRPALPAPEAALAALERVRRHFRDPSYRFAVGPGWLPLVLRCPEAVVAEFPDYELLAVKQKWATLAFQARPRRRTSGGDWTPAESTRLGELVERFRRLSARVCERCGAAGTLRERRPVERTLCDRCDAEMGTDRRLRPRT